MHIARYTMNTNIATLMILKFVALSWIQIQDGEQDLVCHLWGGVVTLKAHLEETRSTSGEYY